MPLTLHIQLHALKDIAGHTPAITNEPSHTYRQIEHLIAEQFPYVDKARSLSAYDYDTGRLLLHLPQQKLTNEQIDFLTANAALSLSIKEFSITPGGWDTSLDEDTTQVVNDLLDRYPPLTKEYQDQLVAIKTYDLSHETKETEGNVTFVNETYGEGEFMYDITKNFGGNEGIEQLILNEGEVDALIALRLRRLVAKKREAHEEDDKQ